ncbi:MAG: 30S ribosomal protein S21 [Parcubacteria group bacterium]|nr:30S ribosomal protein S21 [Parcubacteria group bacterium]
MSEVKRKKGETFESLLRRFNKKILQSGKLLQARKIRFYTRPISKDKRRVLALRRKELRVQREYLQKIGKLEEERTTTGRR